MATKLPPVDIVIVGMGWTGGILAKELGPTGLKIAVLERGGTALARRTTSRCRLIRDELRFSQRHDLMMDVSNDTYTVRNKPSETALPMRRLGSFLPGEGVGGAGAHWNGVTWRWPDHELRIRTKYEERYGKNFIPADMPLQDWGIERGRDRALLRQVRIHRRRLRQGRQHQGPDPEGGQSVRGPARARLSAAAAGFEPRRHRCSPRPRERARLSPLSCGRPPMRRSPTPTQTA